MNQRLHGAVCLKVFRVLRGEAASDLLRIHLQRSLINNTSLEQLNWGMRMSQASLDRN